MPMPVSITATDTDCLEATCALIVMLPFWVNLSALLNRFTRICFTFCRSVRSVGRSDGSLQMT